MKNEYGFWRNEYAENIVNRRKKFVNLLKHNWNKNGYNELYCMGQ